MCAPNRSTEAPAHSNEDGEPTPGVLDCSACFGGAPVAQAALAAWRVSSADALRCFRRGGFELACRLWLPMLKLREPQASSFCLCAAGRWLQRIGDLNDLNCPAVPFPRSARGPQSRSGSGRLAAAILHLPPPQEPVCRTHGVSRICGRQRSPWPCGRSVRSFQCRRSLTKPLLDSRKPRERRRRKERESEHGSGRAKLKRNACPSAAPV